MANVMQQVAYLLDNVPVTRECPNLLVALFWSYFDGVELSQEAAQAIAGATNIETIMRAKRMVLAEAKGEKPDAEAGAGLPDWEGRQANDGNQGLRGQGLPRGNRGSGSGPGECPRQEEHL